MWWMMLLVMALADVNGNLQPPLLCEEARYKCAQRDGCGLALRQYFTGCSAVLQGYQQSYCPGVCQDSLVALTSTEEGKELMRCKCSDKFCEDSKTRVEICRDQVLYASRNETVLSCNVARMICEADASCSTAFDYYTHLCRSMFHGKKCTHKCRNSIRILERQEKSAKLKTCTCEGRDKNDCEKIRNNMKWLCKEHSIFGGGTTETSNVIPRIAQKDSSASTLGFCTTLLFASVLWTLT